MASAKYIKRLEEEFKGLDNLKTNTQCNQFLDFVDASKFETPKIQHSPEAEENLRFECEKFLNKLYASIDEAVRTYNAGKPIQTIGPEDTGQKTEEIDLNMINGAYHSKKT